MGGKGRESERSGGKGGEWRGDEWIGGEGRKGRTPKLYAWLRPCM